MTHKDQASIIYPDAPPAPSPAEEESLDVWGFRDTRFDFNENGHVIIHGSRYELSGKELPRFLPWVREVLECDVNPRNINAPSYPTTIPDPQVSSAFVNDLKQFLRPDQLDKAGEMRLRHGHGHTQEEMYSIKYTRLGRIPDIVVYPESEAEVVNLVEAAKKHGVSLIPYGGGTNVTDALRCDTREQRTIASVDMRRMNRILWIDRTNMMACIEAGAVGRNIMRELEKYGVTMGHEPDSVEFSTLGGWIATNASGMKKNRYGNIEDLVLDVVVVTASGKLERTSASPRESVGLDLRRLIFGSEGTLGIITAAVIKIFPLPGVQKYGSVLFPTFEHGFAFMYDLAREAIPPASVRLVDNLQFRFGLALKPKSQGMLADLKSKAERFFVTTVKGFEPGKMVACTLVFEGTSAEVEQQQRDLYRIAARHGGMKAGAENGRRGYQLTFSIAYIRDFLMNYYIIAESFETSVPWSHALALCENVKRRLVDEYQRRGLPGKPFVSARVTQIYPTGVCIYFYFGFYYKGIPNPQEVYLELENMARDEILKSGGSLSHHHGVGKLRRAFLPRIMSETAIRWKHELKKSLDPANIFGAGNQGLDAR
ncbi:MAG: oxidase [Acidobacteria bacterium 13_1_20CM_2_55_15]|nr:MAG: oxidase [Acidobacteria bacterium 13_1_40CM_56_16]OLD21980.1 MAG: oxidase [Acidobacteria bacterium 13_1_40CM_3_56_11]OLD67855.1 MAG: oxidase [Acidobacteria bacterium 13_1_40CM_2_56_11]OLE88834.1 MAG: oxidase [Acidobacteria bacterium 13_1_20CM_2_55_15]